MKHTVTLYRCERCEHTGTSKQFTYEPYEGHYVCGECGDPVVHEAERRADWISVALYERTREYGGPEEGGWYYDAFYLVTSTIRCFDAGDLPVAEQYRELLRMRNEPSNTAVQVFCEELPDVRTPRHRPVYC